MYVGPPYCRVEMYAGCIACRPLVSYGEYADGINRQTDRRKTVTLRFPLDPASVIIQVQFLQMNRATLRVVNKGGSLV